MRYRVNGVNAKTGEKAAVDVEAGSQAEAFEIAKREYKLFPKSATQRGSRWVYKMVQIPPTIAVSEGTEIGAVASDYLESVVNQHSEKGWEFYRVDEVAVRINPGCLGALLGAPAQYVNYYVITFRQWVEVE